MREHKDAHFWALIAGYSSGFHRFSDPLSQKGQLGSYDVACQLRQTILCERFNVSDIGDPRKGPANSASLDR